MPIVGSVKMLTSSYLVYTSLNVLCLARVASWFSMGEIPNKR
jgi:hypothetical protein